MGDQEEVRNLVECLKNLNLQEECLEDLKNLDLCPKNLVECPNLKGVVNLKEVVNQVEDLSLKEVVNLVDLNNLVELVVHNLEEEEVLQVVLVLQILLHLLSMVPLQNNTLLEIQQQQPLVTKQ